MSNDPAECTHSNPIPGHWVDTMGYIDDETWGKVSEWVEDSYTQTFVDTGVHTYKCTQCHKEFRY